MDEARTIGIVDEVVAPQKLLSRAESLAVRIARGERPDALAATKRLLRPALDVTRPRGAFAALWADTGVADATLPA